MRILTTILLLCLMSALLCGCGFSSDQSGAVKAKSGATVAARNRVQMLPRRIVPRPERWAIWLQAADPELIAASGVDLAVVDYSRDGTDDGAFTRADVARMQAGGRKVLSYFSIGEAERYRFYWQAGWDSAVPPFMGPENPDWPENFKVRYWQEQWWDEALRPYLDRIVDAGFDGVYLDIVDAYWFWFTEGRDLKLCADDMIRLVVRIATYLRERGGPDMIVCPQNANGIVVDASEDAAARYLRYIDMVGVESLLFNSTPEDRDYRIELLKRVAEAGKTVLDIEYIPLKDMPEYKKRMHRLPFALVPYRAEPDAALSSLARQEP